MEGLPDEAAYQPIADEVRKEVAASPAPRASWTSITMNLITAGLGTGILSLPWATAGSSLLVGTGLTIAVMALNASTTMILVSACERHQAFNLGSLLGNIPGSYGRCAQAFCNALTWASVFLCLVGYIVVMADSLETIVFPHLGLDEREVGYMLGRTLLLFVSAAIALPLCFLDQRRLSFSSSLGISVNVYMFALVSALWLLSPGEEPCCLLGEGSGAIAMFSALMQCAIVQMCVPPMYEELEDRSPQRFGSAVAVAFGFLCVLFTAFSAVAYLAFGPHVHSNIIRNFPDNLFGTVARLGMALTVLAVYPIVLKSMVAPIRHWEEPRTSVTNAAIVCIVLLSAAGAMYATELGRLQTVNGAMQVSAFIAVAPSLAGLYLSGREGLLWRLAMYALLVFGLSASALGFHFNSNEVEELTANCVWQL